MLVENYWPKLQYLFDNDFILELRFFERKLSTDLKKKSTWLLRKLASVAAVYCRRPKMLHVTCACRSKACFETALAFHWAPVWWYHVKFVIHFSFVQGPTIFCSSIGSVHFLKRVFKFRPYYLRRIEIIQNFGLCLHEPLWTLCHPSNKM